MQVYFVKTKNVPIVNDNDVGRVNVFRNFRDIEPSIRIAWSKAVNLKIDVTPTPGPVELRVTGVWPQTPSIWEKDTPFEEILEVIRFPVWDSPTHL